MFFKKTKKREEIFLTKSTLVALDMTNKIMHHLTDGNYFKLIHVRMQFSEITNNEKEETQLAHMFPLFEYSGISINCVFRVLLIQSKKRKSIWHVKENEQVIVEFMNEPVFVLNFEDGQLYSPDNAFADKAHCEEVQQRLGKIYTE